MCLRPPRSPLFPYTTLFRSFEDLLSLVLDAFATSRTFSHQSLTRCRTPSPLFGLGRGRGRGPGGGLGRPPAAPPAPGAAGANWLLGSNFRSARLHRALAMKYKHNPAATL